MIGVDTNVLVRFFTQDDPRQSKLASECIKKAVDTRDTVFINDIVVCELCWVLQRAYKFPKTTVIEVLEKIFFTKQFAFENKDVLWRAIGQFHNSRADFADVLIGAKNYDAGCTVTMTFDRSTPDLKTFEVLT
jgi:predicted nucleic-acid-binding protein